MESVERENTTKYHNEREEIKMGKWYGSISNRIEENKNYEGKDIYVGMKVTEYLWSDRHAYEVIKVFDQNHIVIRRLTAKRIDKNGMSECQDYEYISCETNSCEELKKTKAGWKVVITYPAETVQRMANGFKNNYAKRPETFTKTDIKEMETWVKRAEKNKPVSVLGSKINISFGVADEYYDFSF